MVHVSVHCTGLTALRSNCNVGLLPLTAFTVSACTSSPYAVFTPGVGFTSTRCGRGALQLVARVRGTVAIVRLGLRTRVVDHHPRFNVRGQELLRLISFRHNIFMCRNGRCPLHSMGFPAVSPTSPCHLSSRRHRLVRQVRSSFVGDRGVGGRVHYLFACNNVCLIYGDGLLCRTSIPLGTSNDFGRIHVNRGRC